jgi:ribosomal-protein-serine acetyltransferase
MQRGPPAKGAEIRLLEERDADELFSLIDRNREHLKRWMPWLDDTRTVEDSKAFVRRSLEQFARHEGLVEGIWHDGRLAGVVSYVRIDWNNRSAVLGYWIGREYEGRGLVTSACRAMIDHGFDELRLNRIEIKAAVDNERSRAVARRLGFKLEGMERQAAWMYDRFVDMAVFSLLRGEWHSRAGPSGARAR